MSSEIPDQPSIQTPPSSDEPAKALREKSSILWEKTWNDPVAFFTLVLALFSGILVVVSFVQIHFLINADGISEKSAKAATEAAQAAKLNADALMKAEGAQLWMDEVKVHGIRTNPSALKLTYVVRNFGNSPGWVHHKPMNVFIGATLPPQRQLDEMGAPDNIFVPSKHFTSGESTIPTVLAQPVVDALLAPNPTIFMFIYGSINYRDVFGKEHLAGFAYQIRFGSGDVSESFPIAGNEIYWDHQ